TEFCGYEHLLCAATEDDRNAWEVFIMRLVQKSDRVRTSSKDDIRFAVAILLDVPIAKFLLRVLIRKQSGFQILAIELDLVRRFLQSLDDRLVHQAQAWRSERAELIKDKNPPDFFRLRMSLRQERELHRPNEHCEEKCLNSRSNECSPGALNRF